MACGTKGFIRLNAPIPALTLPHVFSVCFFQLNFSFKFTLKHVKISARGIRASFNRTQLSSTFLFKLRDDLMNITFCEMMFMLIFRKPLPDVV